MSAAYLDLLIEQDLRHFAAKIPDDYEHDFRCWKLDCDERATHDVQTCWGRGLFCRDHAGEVVERWPSDTPLFTPGNFPEWVRQSYYQAGAQYDNGFPSPDGHRAWLEERGIRDEPGWAED